MQQQCIETYLSSTISDHDIAQLIITGDVDAFEIFIQRYQVPLFNFVLHIMEDYEGAKDIAQETFLKFYLMLPDLDYTKPLRPWLFQVAYHYCIDEMRKKKKQTIPFSQFDIDGESSELALLADPGLSVDDMINQRDLQSFLQQAIARLPVKQRAVVTLRYTSNMRFQDIAVVLGISEPTLKTYFHRAKRRLQEILKNDGMQYLLH